MCIERCVVLVVYTDCCLVELFCVVSVLCNVRIIVLFLLCVMYMCMCCMVSV